ncbi:MAG: GNAT family N-acetyltransferase [Ruminococcaceae bacterium]|nr:GNAT family N-acetyltransferase [Oscillospiraceae bacterium]
MGDITFRSATREDVGKVLYFIKKLAEYQKLGEEMIATEELLCEWLFEKEKAEVIFCLYDGREVGFAVFYHNFSTMLGRCGIHLEDLYVEKEYRGKGCGKALLRKLAAIARERNCGRLEWCCLDWNRRSVEFYLSLGARPMEGWTTYRLSGEALENL